MTSQPRAYSKWRALGCLALFPVLAAAQPHVTGAVPPRWRESAQSHGVAPRASWQDVPRRALGGGGIGGGGARVLPREEGGSEGDPNDTGDGAGEAWASGGGGKYATPKKGKAAMERQFASELAAGRTTEPGSVEVVAGGGGGGGGGTLLERAQTQLLVLIAAIIKFCKGHGVIVEAKHIVFTAAALLLCCGCCLVCRGAKRSRRRDAGADRRAGGYKGAPYPGDHAYEMVEVGMEENDDDEEGLVGGGGGGGDEAGAGGGGGGGGGEAGKDSWAWDSGISEMDDEYGCVLDDGFSEIANGGALDDDEFKSGHGVEDL
jgi:hypothetical protein